MEKRAEPKGVVPEQIAAAPSLASAAPSRLQCLPARSAIANADDDELEDEDDGFQCPCCLPR